MPASLQRIVEHCEKLLKSNEFTDWPGAVNGLQVENNGTVTRIAAAVDATNSTLRLCAEQKADLLIVHHGLFWNASHPWTGARYQVLRKLFDNNIAVYSSHLPLDAHPELGNNAQLATALGLKNLKPFFFEKGRFLGFRAKANLTRDALSDRLAKVLGKSPILLPGGSEKCRDIGIVTGGGGGEIRLAANEGVDTFITGEGPHYTYAVAEEAGINVFYGGHYATETFGVKALAENLSKKFKRPWIFLDYPTGL
jgi:dinuclear metal center YbgI/SA1388 family protein